MTRLGGWNCLPGFITDLHFSQVLHLIPCIFFVLPTGITQTLRISVPQAPLGPKIPVHKMISNCTSHYRCVRSLRQRRDTGKERERCRCPFWLCKREQARRHPESALESIPRNDSAGQSCDSEHSTPILNRHKETSQQLLTMISLGGKI